MLWRKSNKSLDYLNSLTSLINLKLKLFWNYIKINHKKTWENNIKFHNFLKIKLKIMGIRGQIKIKDNDDT